MTRIFYPFFIAVYSLVIRIAAFWNPKARKWVMGRRAFPKIPVADGAVVWMHCASLGEFEQGRPVLEQLRTEYPACKIVLSFFSPSGFEVCKDYSGADHIFYLPADTPANARRFIAAIRPSLVLWVKYEYWFNYLFVLRQQGIPLLLLSGIFRKDQPFFAWYGRHWRRVLGCFTHLFVQSADAAALLAGLGYSETVTVAGDTRFDRVLQIASQFVPIAPIDRFCAGHDVLVAGSTWEEDEAELVHYVRQHPALRFIVAPHEVDRQNLLDVRKTFPGSVFYSDWVKGAGEGVQVLIMDNIGMLSRLYRYATITYVGGGFGNDGVHNVLEAAVYGKPVVFGPEYDKYAEATGLVDAGGAFSIAQALELEQLLDGLLGDRGSLERAGQAAADFVTAQAGATEKVLYYIQEKRLLTN